MEDEICENCGRAIGKLEQAFVHKGHVVCKECNRKLCDEPKETQPSQAKSQQAHSAPNSHPLKPLHKQNWLARYKARCGTRSFAFQCCLLGWTFLIIYLLKDIGPLRLEPGVGYSGAEVRASETAPAQCFCLLATWFLLAVPLGIGAIACFGKDKK